MIVGWALTVAWGGDPAPPDVEEIADAFVEAYFTAPGSEPPERGAVLAIWGPYLAPGHWTMADAAATSLDGEILFSAGIAHARLVLLEDPVEGWRGHHLTVDPPPIPTGSGFAQLWVRPTALPRGSGRIEVRNPHTTRSVLGLDGVELGTVDPRGVAIVRNVRAGTWDVTWTTPEGFRREEEIVVSP